MAIIERLDFAPCHDDADDYRPNSSWAFAVDPATHDGVYVREMTVMVDRVAPGDRVPLHTHDIDELVVVHDGTPQVRLGDETKVVSPGSLIFVPAGVAHGGGADEGPVTFLGIFAADAFITTYVERSPAPGTENEPPQPPTVFNARA